MYLIAAIIMLLSFLMLLSFAASAQEATPQTRALNAKLGNEINANLQCGSSLFELQDKVKAGEAEIKRLRDKYEPEKK